MLREVAGKKGGPAGSGGVKAGNKARLLTPVLPMLAQVLFELRWKFMIKKCLLKKIEKYVKFTRSNGFFQVFTHF